MTMRGDARTTTTFALAVAVLGGCHRAPAEGARPDAPSAAGPDAQDALLPARCRKTPTGFALDDGHALADLEVGDAVAHPGGYALSLVHHAAAGRVAAVALLQSDPIGLTRVVDLGPTMGDAPPPRIAWRAGELVAAAYTRPLDTRGGAPDAGAPSGRGDATRDVTLYTVADGARGAAPLSIPQRRDDSLALDLAFAGPTGLLVWDEATDAPRGVIKAAAFVRDHAGVARDVSPPESDAELPRVVSLGGAFAVVWIARRPEPGSSLDGAQSEVTGEPRAYGWLETVTVDAQGQPRGSVRRLTASTGHVSAYDVATLEPSAWLVVARDDGEAVDGSGGTLLRVRVTGDLVDPPVAVATDGLGRGAPTLVPTVDTKGSGRIPGGPALALAWVGKDEQARLQPLDVAGAPTASPSAEDALSDGRALLIAAAEGPTAAPAYDVLVATPSDSAAQLRVFACAR
jgi:hypothetical protein